MVWQIGPISSFLNLAISDLEKFTLLRSSSLTGLDWLAYTVRGSAHLSANFIKTALMAFVDAVVPFELPRAICSSWSTRTIFVSIVALVVAKLVMPDVAVVLFVQ